MPIVKCFNCYHSSQVQALLCLHVIFLPAGRFVVFRLRGFAGFCRGLQLGGFRVSVCVRESNIHTATRTNSEQRRACLFGRETPCGHELTWEFL